MNANSVSLGVSIIVGVIGIYLAMRSWRIYGDVPVTRVRELEIVRRTLQREISDMQVRIDALEAAQAERDALIHTQAERIAYLESELELYRVNWANATKGRASAAAAPPVRAKRLTTAQLRALRDVLVQAYGDQSRAREIAERAGIKPDSLPIDKPDMATWWDATLYAANNQNRVVQLVETALNDEAVFALHEDLVHWLETKAG
jgi:hypothetical protein